MRGRRGDKGYLAARWSKKERDVMFDFPCRPDGHMLHNFFDFAQAPGCQTFLKELKARGYDLETLEFSVRRIKS